MRTAIFRATGLLALLAATPAGASSILYTTTDLGAGYTLQADAAGQVHGLTNANGSVTYAFEKSPVTPINIRTDYQIHDSYKLLNMQNNGHQAGYTYDQFPQIGGIRIASVNSAFDWYTNPHGGYPQSPILDLNSHGQVVGASILDGGSTYAAFSDVNGNSHGFNSFIVNNLNNYIGSLPGVSLTVALNIDDMGRIAATGSNGHEYLLTPVELGSAATVPEPSALATLGLAGLAVGFRSFGRRLRR